MSFSEKVRREICTYITDKDKRFACLYGMLLFCRTLNRNNVCFQTKSRISAETFSILFEKVFRIKPDCKETISTNGRSVYTFHLKPPESTAVFVKYRIDGNQRHINSEIISTSSLGIFTAGIFLACGSVNDPEKEYHLEFTVTDEPLADELIALLGDIGVTAKRSARRGQHIVYIKGSDYIEDTLTFIGAQQCTLEMINVRIFKDIRNKANRIANCDTANIDKTVNASIRQINDIQLIAGTKGLESLPDELLEIAQLRLDNEDMSLRDIGENLSEPISRSGVNHRFQRIAKIADGIRKELNK